MSVPELAAALSEAGIGCDVVSKRHARYVSDGVAWSVFERSDGLLRMRSDSGMGVEDVVRMSAHGRVELSGDGVVGHAKCSACGGSVSPYDSYCRHCGVRILGGW